MNKDRKKIGIIGFGNMGSAIAERLKSNYDISVTDKDARKTSNIAGLRVVSNNITLIKIVDALILAVKPQDFDVCLNEIKKYIEDKLIISIAAGISCSHIERILGKERLIRVMPNLAAKIGKGMSCISKGNFASEVDLEFSKKIFNELGEILVIEENLMNAATAVSGSGPGFFYWLIKDKPQKDWLDFAKNVFTLALSKAAENIGFSQEQALILAKATGEGSLALLKTTHLSPKELCSQVASKGGTTQAGLGVLERGGSLIEAVKAALKRSQELSRSSEA
ncbi:MAG: pyrroline-5-carboxylate reductase [Candidatus Omnitrophota bacterium]